MNLSPSLHQSAQGCSHFSWSTKKLRRQHVGKRENVAIIIPGKPVKKSPIERNYFPDIFCHIFSPKRARKFGVALPKAAERPRMDTKAAWTSPRQDPPGSSWPKKDDPNFLWDCAGLCWTDLIFWVFYFFEHLFSPYLDMDWWEKSTVYTGQPSRSPAGKKPLIFTIFVLYSTEVSEVKNKNTATEKTKCFSLNFSDGKCSAVSAVQSSHSYK